MSNADRLGSFAQPLREAALFHLLFTGEGGTFYEV